MEINCVYLFAEFCENQEKNQLIGLNSCKSMVLLLFFNSSRSCLNHLVSYKYKLWSFFYQCSEFSYQPSILLNGIAKADLPLSCSFEKHTKRSIVEATNAKDLDFIGHIPFFITKPKLSHTSLGLRLEGSLESKK